MRPLILLTLLLGLAACGDKGNVKPDLPGAGMVVQPKIVYVDRIVYVKVPSQLTAPQPIAEGPISECFTVAAARRKALQVCNANLQRIDAIEGTEVKP